MVDSLLWQTQTATGIAASITRKDTPDELDADQVVAILMDGRDAEWVL
jgi:hypothetical protein